MTDLIKAELENIRKQKEQTIAQLNALIGAEKVLEKVITQAETPEKGEKKDADTDTDRPE